MGCAVVGGLVVVVTRGFCGVEGGAVIGAGEGVGGHVSAVVPENLEYKNQFETVTEEFL